MKKRSAIVLMLAALLLGCVAGGTGVYVTTVKRARSSVLKDMTTIMAAEHLWHAKLLRDKKQEEVLSLLEGTFPDTVRWYKAFGYHEPRDIRMLWSIRDYYEHRSLSMPDDIQSVLGSLPTRPPSACDVKSQVPADQSAAANRR